MLPLLPLNLSRSSGVTLMELLIGLVIVSIGMTVAVPSFQGMIARNTVATDVNEMLFAINLARSEASRTGSSVKILATTPTEDNEFGTGWCVVPDDQIDCSANGIRAFSGTNPNSSLNLVDDGGEEAIIFSARGGLSNFQNVSIDYCYEGQLGRRIFISPIGRSKSHRPDDADLSRRPDC
ncbi:MAG: type IV fimbrial biogenesis protein FimT [Planctomycetaceae bacterium]|jgi:type IV fimbrial biogenesis protein FimT